MRYFYGSEQKRLYTPRARKTASGGLVSSGLSSVDSTVESSTTTMQASVTRNDVTWTFDHEYPVGQFVTGDYFVIADPSVVITSVSPSPQTVSGYYQNGSMINPTTDQAYDSRSVGWNDSLQVTYPVTIDYDASLVSTISREPWGDGSITRPSLEQAEVLTVLTSVPDDGMFRPGIMGPTKTLYNSNAINWSLLPNLPVTPLAETATHFEAQNAYVYSFERWFQRPWLLHNNSWENERTAPRQNMPSYHMYLAQLLSQAAVLAISDRSDLTTMRLNYIQVGLDYYNMKMTTPDSGAYSYFFPTVFAGILLGQSDMRDLYWSAGDYHAHWHPHLSSKPRLYTGIGGYAGESSNFPITSPTGVTLGGDTPFGQDTWTGYYARTGRQPVFYNSGPEFEQLHPSAWRSLPQDSCSTYKRLHSVGPVGFALAGWALGAMDYVNNNAYLPYVIRWMYETDEIILDSLPDGSDSSFYPPDYGPSVHPYATSRREFVDEMWAQYESQIVADVLGE